jgi:hypothetical protein
MHIIFTYINRSSFKLWYFSITEVHPIAILRPLTSSAAKSDIWRRIIQLLFPFLSAGRALITEHHPPQLPQPSHSAISKAKNGS